MRLSPSQPANIVIVGRWNPDIFLPPWLGRSLIEDMDIPITVAFNVGNVSAPLRFTFQAINLFPSREVLELSPVAFSDDALTRCGEIAQRILTLLPHTPISATGFNFRFEEDQEAERISSLFGARDAQNISADTYSLNIATTNRAFSLADGSVLNLLVAYGAGPVRLEYNWHLNTNDPQRARNHLSPEHILRRRDESLNFARRVYNLELDQQTHMEAVQG